MAAGWAMADRSGARAVRRSLPLVEAGKRPVQVAWEPLDREEKQLEQLAAQANEVRARIRMLRDEISTQAAILEESRPAGAGFRVAEKRELWWNPRPGKGEVVWGSHVRLSNRFFREATEAPVPFDLRVLRALRSPFEIDIYVWPT